MKKLHLAATLLLLILQACSLPGVARPTPTLTSTPEPSFTPTPSPTSTSTPTPIPTATPTPAPEVRVAVGDHALFNGDYASAITEYASAFDASADPAVRAAALLGQGRYHYLTGVYPNALTEFRQVTADYASSPQAAEAYYFLGETYLQLDRYTEAAQAYAKYLEIHPGAIDAYINERLGDALTANGDYSGALTAYTNAVQSPRLPTNFSLELKLGQAYVYLGDYTTASVVYDDIYNRTSAENIRAQVDYARGQMYTLLGQTEAATTAFVNAVFNEPNSYFSYLSLIELVNSGYQVDELQRGLVDFNAKQYDVALAAFERYLAGSPSEPSTAYYYEGLILRKQGDLEGAIAAWDNVIDGDTTSSVWDQAWEQKAYTQWAFQYDDASAETTLLDFVAAVPTHPRAAEFLYDAGRSAERGGKLADAARLWQRVASEYPNSDYVYRSLFQAGICFVRLQDYVSAQTVFWQAQAVASSPSERAGAHFWIGKAQSAQGDATAAQASWTLAVSIDPTGYYSERSRDILNNQSPFTPPEMVDLSTDRPSEIRLAELWMRTTFNFPPETDFSVPGPIAGDARFTRGKAFWDFGLTDQAEAEFSDLRDSVASDPLASYRLAVYLSDLGMYRQAIMSARQVLDLAGLDDAGTLTAPVLFSHIRFGAYYPDLVVPLAQEYGLHPLFAWSAIRQESLFDPDIESSAGAVGLMQIVPETGAEIASRMGWPPDYTSADLARPEVNLRLGLDYLASQRDRLGGDLYAALAAYNGGPGNAADWQSISSNDPDLFVEVVRFDETRRYLQAIYELFSIYSRLYARVP